MSIQVVTQAPLADGSPFQIAPRLGLESPDVQKHVEEARGEEIAALGEKGAENSPAFTPAPFKAPPIGGDRKAHFGGLGGDAQPLQHRGKIRIIQSVIDDEPGIDRDLGAGMFDIDGRRMAARPQILLIERDLMARMGQRQRRSHSRNARSDDGYAHVVSQARRQSGS